MIFDLPTEAARDLGREWSRLSAISATTEHEPVLWSFAPHFIGNPYQEILYSAMASQGFAVRGGRTYQKGVDQLDVNVSFPKVLHLHWLNMVLHKANTEAECKRRIDDFTRLLDEQLERGIRLVWTMHNVLPHESRFTDQEIALRNVMIERAEMVHIMSPESVALSADLFEVPASKVVRVEHPGYSGFYPMWQDRHSARTLLGISPFERMFLVLGAIKPYKGLLELAEFFDALTREYPRQFSLVVAGQPSEDAETKKLLDLAAAHPSIHVIAERLSSERVGLLYSATDAAVIPYRASLNSGALVLGLSMGKPVIARDSAGSTHLLRNGSGRIYSSDAELKAAITDGGWLSAAAQQAEVMARKLHPGDMSTLFAKTARAFVDDGIDAARKVAEGGHGDV